MMRTLCLSFILMVMAFSAHAQEAVLSYVEVDAEHTVLLQPNYVAFAVEFYVGPAASGETADSAATAAAAVDEKQKAFREALNELDLHPIEIEFSVPSVRSAIPVAVSAGARMKFSLAGFVNPDTGPAQFAALCDKIAGIAAKTNAQLAGPEFGVDDEESAVRSAVTLATTDAYPIGDALALALSARVESVDSVKVIEVTWSKQPAADKLLLGTSVALEPNLRQIACTAKVHVTYSVHSTTP